MENFDVIVIGGGQSGLATGYYLRRSGLSFIILDNQDKPGGAWLHTWRSLKLFSPAQWSSLPGMSMKTDNSEAYPSRELTIRYLKDYETKYALPVKRNVAVTNIKKNGNEFVVETSAGLFYSRAIVSSTGSFNHPYIPDFRGAEKFKGQILHSSQYQSPDSFKGKYVAIVGEGNSGAQILAEVSTVAKTIWITKKEPVFLPDHVDGRYLFDAATRQYEAQKTGTAFNPPSLGDIVMVDPVKDARSRNVLQSSRPFDHFTADSLVWADGRKEKIDAVIFCTGFKPSLKHLAGLNAFNRDGRMDVAGTKSVEVEGLWLVGYGNWTGFASATLIGVGRSAKKTVEEIQTYINKPDA